MKNLTKVALMVITAGVSTTGYGFSSSSATANCKQTLNQMQNIQCGNVSNLSINVSGGGNVMFGPTICSVTANQTATQIANCTAIAGKAGDILTFSATELPQTVGTNVFNLGTISSRKDVNGIAAPKDGNGVILNFLTSAGLPISFLIKRKAFTLAELDALGTSTQADIDFKNSLKAKFPSGGAPAILTAYYRQIPGMESTWTELFTDLDSPASYPFDPKFNATVYPNGLVVLRTNLNKSADIKETKRLFFVGDYELKPTDAIVPAPANGIPVGGGRTVSPKDL